LYVVAMNRKGIDIVNQTIVEKSDIVKKNYKGYLDYAKRKEYFEQAGVEFNEIYVPEVIEKDGLQFGKLILKSIVVYNPDIIIMESTIGKYSLFEKSSFANLLMYRLNCPIVIVKDFSFPLVNIVKHILLKITGHLGPFYLVKLLRKNKR
jgi:basic amino acid/polyamine antiporter, APA family